VADDEKRKRRSPLKQSDVPAVLLTEAVRVPQAIADNYAKKPTKPLDVAIALNMSATSGPFRTLTGATVAYGLTDKGAQGNVISLTDLGRRVVAPLHEGDDLVAKRLALLQPRVVREFLQQYDGNSLPKDDVAWNVLETMGVPTDATADALSMILENARSFGLTKEHKGKTYVRLDTIEDLPEDAEAIEHEEKELVEESHNVDSVNEPLSKTGQPPKDLGWNKRVFVTHGENAQIVSQLKELLEYGDLEPVVSEERESVAQPVPDKVLGNMRECGAAIVHVGGEHRMLDQEGLEHIILNQNVLIEIGAAMALYDRRFILLVEEGVSLPSNLQGMYEVRYEGDRLDYDATMKLLKAFNEFKRQT
jgi:predicted nucleotide-binding protein